MIINKTKYMLLLAIALTLLSGCGSNNINTHPDIHVTTFKIDNNTVRQINEYKNTENNTEDNIEESNNDNNDEEINTLKPRINIAEIDIITNENNATEAYYTDGTNIIYNDIVFNNLRTVINSVEQYSNYNSDELIGFILTTYKTDTNVECHLEIDDEQYISKDSYGSIANNISKSYYGYDTISDIYNNDVAWHLQLNGIDNSKQAHLYGCTSYTLVAELTESISVEINNFTEQKIQEEQINQEEDNIGID